MVTVAMRHAELIQSLGDFCTLIAQLQSMDPVSLVELPTPDIIARVRRSEALEAGYTDKVVSLLEQLH